MKLAFLTLMVAGIAGCTAENEVGSAAAPPSGELAAELAQNAPLAMNLTKANARLAVAEGEPAAIAALPDVQRALSTTADLAEGVASFVERRPARFTGR